MGESEANARLIAAAPEMLEALRMVKAMMEREEMQISFNEEFYAIAQAIAKAQGDAVSK